MILIPVTTGRKSFLSAIAKFIAPVTEEITQSADEVRIRLISQLMSPILDKLLGGCSRMGGGWGGGQKSPSSPKICHRYPAMMKLHSYTLPKEDRKTI